MLASARLDEPALVGEHDRLGAVAEIQLHQFTVPGVAAVVADQAL
jgi:hypothetical protein